MKAQTGAAAAELSRDLGFFAVFATATGTMIGAGIFVLPGVAAEAAGPGAAISFLVAGLIAGVAALSASELATAMPKAGGPYVFVSRAMGPAVGTIVGLGAWLALVLKGSFALVGLGQYVLHFTPVPVLLTAALGGALLVAVNAPAETRVMRHDDVARAVVEAGRNFDLIVVGASREPAYRRLVGRIPDLVAAWSDRTVLVTRDPGIPQVWRPRLAASLDRLRRWAGSGDGT